MGGGRGAGWAARDNAGLMRAVPLPFLSQGPGTTKWEDKYFSSGSWDASHRTDAAGRRSHAVSLCEREEHTGGLWTCVGETE